MNNQRQHHSYISAIKQRRLLKILLLLIAIIVIELAGSNFKVAHAQELPQLTGSMQGRVLSESGEPLAGITVTVYRPTDLNTFDWSIHKQVETTVDGEYTVDVLVTGKYRVGFSAGDGMWQDLYLPSAQTLSDAQDIFVAGNNVDLPDVKLLPAGSMTGIVAMYDGKGPDSMEVRIDSWSDYSTIQTLIIRGAGGGPAAFASKGLAPGRYSINVSTYYQGNYYSWSYRNNVPGTQGIRIVAGETTPLPPITLGVDPNAGDISGRITDAAGNGLAGITVMAVGGYSNPVQETDATGFYQLRMLLPGEYTLVANDETLRFAPTWYGDVAHKEQSTRINVSPGEERQNSDIRMLPGGAIVSPVTFDGGQAADEADWKLYHRLYPDAEWQVIQKGRYNSYSNIKMVVIAGLAPGTYRLGVDAARKEDYSGRYREYYQESLTLESASDISVTQGQTATVPIELGRLPDYAQLSGEIRSTAGDALTGINVEAEVLVDDGSSFEKWEPVRRNTTVNGTYVLSALIPGKYRLRVSDADGEYIPHIYVGTDPVANGFDVAAGETRPLADIVVKRKGIASGALRLFDDSYIHKVYFQWYSFTDGEWDPDYSISSPSLSAPASVITYTFTKLLPGSYRLAVSVSDGMRTHTAFYGQSVDVDQAATITITGDSELAGLDIIVGSDQDAGSITGTVSRGVEPAGDVEIALYRENYCVNLYPAMEIGRTRTNREGAYRFAALPRGGYCAGLAGHLPTEELEYVNLEANDSTAMVNFQLYAEDGLLFLPALSR
jgi:hypothetical protein